MNGSYSESQPLTSFPLWEKIQNKRVPLSFDLEVTARCNNNCRHCYINLAAGDRAAKAKEFSLKEIKGITEEAISLGALWCLITGGEPLLRDDFFDIYLHLKGKGILVGIFTNATLITKEHVRLFQKFPPRDIEVTVYGQTPDTYERVTRTPGSFQAFRRGLDLLLAGGLKVRLKTMALRSNVAELPAISRFCREKTKDYFRFDPFLHLRFDGNPARNEEIKNERLSAGEITELEKADPERFQALQNKCAQWIVPPSASVAGSELFHCGVGNGSFTLGYDGFLRICPSLNHPDCVLDVRKRSLSWAWPTLVSRVRNIRSAQKEFLENCCVCPLFNLCMWCPANAYLETGEWDRPLTYFCELAHARAALCRRGEEGKQVSQ